MAVIDWSIFLDKLCLWLATGAGLQYAGTPRQLWQGSAVEADAADPYSVVRVYGGSIPNVPTPLVSVQCKTIATSVTAAVAQSALIYAQLVDPTSGAPLRMVTILARAGSVAGVRANAIDPKQPPSFLSRDDRGRAEVVFNVDLRLAAL